MDFLEFAEKILREVNRPLTHIELWEIGKNKGIDSDLNSRGKTPWQTIAARIYVDIRDNTNSKFVKLKLRPTKFFLKELMTDNLRQGIEPVASVNIPILESRNINYHERLLHKYLSYYLYTYQIIYSKTIYHEESTRGSFSEWLHPDIVGVYFPIGQWETEVLDISKEIGSIGMKLYSFEIKKELNFSNLRKHFFQAVSNSSWANESYLVVAEYSQDEDFYGEFKRLSNSFGIGLIHLDIDDPDSSSIIFQSKTKEIIDMETMNKLAQLNPNFKEFLKRIKLDSTTKEIRKEKYDIIFDISELENKKGLKEI